METRENLEQIATFDFESKETWEQDWNTANDPMFHLKEVNAMLMKHYKAFAGGRKGLRILVPLCGKSLDMIWLADQGHSVVGVELIRKGIEAFLQDNKLTHREECVTLSPEIQGTIFKVDEKDISLYECSIFDFSAAVAGGQFDLIWDRGSMTAINMMKDERMKQYCDLMLSCLKLDGRYFLEFFAAESTEGMPSTFKFISEKALNERFGDRCTIQYLGTEKMSEEEAATESEQPGCVEEHEENPFLMHYYFMDFK